MGWLGDQAQHRPTEEDRFTGLPTEEANPGGGQAAERTHPPAPARTLSIQKFELKFTPLALNILISQQFLQLQPLILALGQARF